MAKYKANPFYRVQISKDKAIEFNFFGEFETNDEVEAEALNELCPEYMTCLDNSGIKPKVEVAPKPKAPKKTSGK